MEITKQQTQGILTATLGSKQPRNMSRHEMDISQHAMCTLELLYTHKLHRAPLMALSHIASDTKKVFLKTLFLRRNGIQSVREGTVKNLMEIHF